MWYFLFYPSVALYEIISNVPVLGPFCGISNVPVLWEATIVRMAGASGASGRDETPRTSNQLPMLIGDGLRFRIKRK
jgi:hypothetical protein